MAVRNVRARILVTRSIPGLPEFQAPLTIWWLGARFHVREESGRSFREVAEDVVAARGFGTLPRTVEGLMDAHIRFDGHVDVTGAVDTERGTVTEPWGDVWKCPIAHLTPLATQFLAGELGGQTQRGRTRLLDRDGTEYTGRLEGTEDGRSYRSNVRRVVSGAYVLLREVTDEVGPMRLRAEVTALDEGAVGEGDVKA